MYIKIKDYSEIGCRENNNGYIIRCDQQSDYITIEKKNIDETEILLSINYKKLSDDKIFPLVEIFGFYLILVGECY